MEEDEKKCTHETDWLSAPLSVDYAPLVGQSNQLLHEGHAFSEFWICWAGEMHQAHLLILALYHNANRLKIGQVLLEWREKLERGW